MKTPGPAGFAGRLLSLLGLGAVLSTAALTGSLAEHRKRVRWEDITFSGNCRAFLLSPRPNQRIFYRYYLHDWRYGDDRDLTCFIQDY